MWTVTTSLRVPSLCLCNKIFFCLGVLWIVSTLSQCLRLLSRSQFLQLQQQATVLLKALKVPGVPRRSPRWEKRLRALIKSRCGKKSGGVKAEDQWGLRPLVKTVWRCWNTDTSPRSSGSGNVPPFLPLPRRPSGGKMQSTRLNSGFWKRALQDSSDPKRLLATSRGTKLG